MSHDNSNVIKTTFNTPEYERLVPETPENSTRSVNQQTQDYTPVPQQLNLPIKTSTVRYVPNSGWSRYKSAVQTLLPFRRKRNDVPGLPVDNVGLFSYITFSWLFNTVQQIDETNLPPCSPLDSCDINGQRLHHIWREQSLRTGQKDLKMLTVVLRFVRTRVIVTSVIHILGIIINIKGAVLCLRKLLETEDTIEAIFWGLGIMLIELLSAFLLVWSDSIACRTAVRLRSASASLAYNKLVRLSNQNTLSTQQMVSLLGTDGQKLYDAVLYGTHVVVSPIVFLYSIISILFIIHEKTVDIFINILVSLLPFILTYLLLYVLIRLGGYLSSQGTMLCRQRIALVHEMLVHVRLVKMTLWEKVLSQHIKGTRHEELKFIWRQFLCDGLSKLLFNVIPITALLLYLYTRIGETIEASEIIPLIALFCGFMRESLITFWLGLKKISEALPSLERFKNILLLEEVVKFSDKPINRLMAVNISNGNFVWDNVKKEGKNERKKTKRPMSMTYELSRLDGNEKLHPDLMDIGFLAPKGKLIGVCGLAKSGKTSLLLAILGHLHKTSGQVFRDGSCAFVGQRPWIWNATVRENILFKEPFDHKRYYKCLVNCYLNDDINALPQQDDTQIDEMSLSPGQKQRIALARALYAKRDIYLLDNPLSLVDATMAASVFEKSILKALKDNTVILATRHVQFLTRCDEVYIMDKGKIIASGTHEQLLRENPQYACIVKAYTSENSKKYFIETKRQQRNASSMTTFLTQHIQPSSSIHSFNSHEDENDGGRLDAIDLNRIGPLAAYVAYLGSKCTYIAIILGLVSLLISSLCLFGVPLSVTHFQKEWSKLGEIVNALLLLLMLISGLIWSFIFVKVVVGVSQRTHNSWFEKLCRAPVGYFQATPAMMLVVNLFSLDIRDLDYILPSTLSQLLHSTVLLLCVVSVVLYLSPYCVTVLLVAVTVTLLWLARKHRKCILKLFAVEVGSRGPLYQHVANSITGRIYIQAFSKEKEFIADFTKQCDDNITCTYLLSAANHWLAFRVRLIGAVTVGIVAVVLIMTEPIQWLKDSSSESLPHWIHGITLVIVFEMGQCIHHILQAGCESEARLNLFAESSQCIQGIKNEDQKIKIRTNQLPANWPTDGSIVFENVKTAALPQTLLMLNGMSFRIQSGQKIGVVGLPGSGKKLLVDALFHLIDITHGKIMIGGTDIRNVPLEKLRSSIAIIPQDPVLFTGTIRLNLDPHNMYQDAQLFESIRKVNLHEDIERLPGHLDALVDRNGDRLSAGKRQMLCLAKACLKDTKILIFEESLATMSDELESVLNFVLRDLFPNTTVLTIAHQMKYVLNCDKIMVVEMGKVVEFDTPAKLYRNRESYFSRMITASTGNLFETEL